jgi:prepilin signal peptidase PulO-like enzyme (type II secretory pathway)
MEKRTVYMGLFVITSALLIGSLYTLYIKKYKDESTREFLNILNMFLAAIVLVLLAVLTTKPEYINTF